MADGGMKTVQVPAQSLASECRKLLQGAGARLAAVFACDEREAGAGFSVHAVVSLPMDREYVELAAELAGTEPRYPSLTPHIPSAHAFERELWESFGVVPAGHPDLRRLLLHEDWPEGTYPLRKDFPQGSKPARALGGTFRFQRVEGDGVFEIPVGPVHAGIIEPGHFRFGVAGEPIINLEIRLGYVHKGIEKLAEGRDALAAADLAERVSGDASFAHGLAYCRAVEGVSGAVVPPRGAALRVLFAELERLYNHLGDIAGVATDVGFPFGAAQMLILRERVLQSNYLLAGHRLLRGVNVPGGMARAPEGEALEQLRPFLRALEDDYGEVERLLLNTDSLMDRAEGAGILSRRIAEDLGGVGPAVRASGVDEDLRRDHPYGAYGALRLEVPVLEAGDVAARMKVKMSEFRQSLSLLHQVLDAIPEGPAMAPLASVGAGSALGWAESSRGEALHWLRTDAKGRIERLKIKSPSFSNWPLLPWAVRDNIVPDFPLINKSFNLSYSGNDR